MIRIAAFLGALATVGFSAAGSSVGAPLGHSEPAPRATLSGTAYISVSPPPGHHAAGPQPTAGITVELTQRGQVLARGVTRADGRFRLRARPGLYVLMSRVGPPIAVPGHSCGRPRRVHVSASRPLRVRLVCNLR
jgi:hypothetical protein